MRARLGAYWLSLQASYWFVPILMSTGAVLLSFLVIRLEAWLGRELVQSLGWVYSGGADGARGVLTAIASSVITVAGTTFSITIASLSLASSQFGPRVLRGFMRDRGNQLVLGTFTSTFLYCLLVLRTVRGGDEGVYVPHLGVTAAVALAVVCVGVLIYFIHHAAQSVQVSHILNVAGTELDRSIDRLFPERIGTPEGSGSLPEALHEPARAKEQGYVSAIDADALLSLATDRDRQFRLIARPGDYVVPGDPLVSVWPPCDEETAAAIRRCYVFSADRSAEQDAVFAFEQLAEIGVRALSPGINDPYTAIAVIDRLTAAVNRLDGRDLPPSERFDEEGRLRVVAEPPPMASYVSAAFDAIIMSAERQPLVLRHLARRLHERIGSSRHSALRQSLEETLERVERLLASD